jgi:hypothetical protein
MIYLRCTQRGVQSRRRCGRGGPSPGADVRGGAQSRYIVRNTRCTTGEVCRRSCKGNPDGRRSCPAGRCEGGVLGPRVQTATAGTSYTCTGTRPRLQHLNQDREWAHPALICSRTEAYVFPQLRRDGRGFAPVPHLRRDSAIALRRRRMLRSAHCTRSGCSRC